MRKIEIPFVSRCFFTYEHFDNNNKNILLLCSDEENALSSYKQMLFLEDSRDETAKILYFPSLDTVPYDRISPNGEVLS